MNGTDPKNNEQVIDIANSIISSDLSVSITGYTAHYDSEESCRTLSLSRAEAMKSVLISMGCPADKININGGGWGPHQYGDEGKSNNEIDQMNRCVKFDLV